MRVKTTDKRTAGRGTLAIALVTLGFFAIGLLLAFVSVQFGAELEPPRSRVEADLAEAIPEARLLSIEPVWGEVDAVAVRLEYEAPGDAKGSVVWHYVRHPEIGWRRVATEP